MSEIESEWRFIKTNRTGSCKLCETQLQPDEQVLYSWKQKAVWCLECAKKLGHIPCNGSKNVQEREGQGLINSPKEACVSKPTEALVVARARWEIVTGDDGIIVLRRLI